MKKLLARRSCLAIILLLLLLSGCGYAFRPQTEGAKRVEVATFANETFKPGLEAMARDLLLQRLAERKIPVAEPPEADWTLEGTITGYSISPVAFDSRNISREYRLSIAIKALLKERVSQKVLWEDTLSAVSYYYTGSNVAATQIAAYDGAFRALKELSGRLTSRLMEDF
jgi:outer membrane lipopolysaccharide assembly protein LptE/RlpB